MELEDYVSNIKKSYANKIKRRKQMNITKEDIGREVWDFRFGNGTITEFNGTRKYKVTVMFGSDEIIFTEKGFLSIFDINPTLFWNEFNIPSIAFEKPRWRAEGGETYYIVMYHNGYFCLEERVESYTVCDKRLYNNFNYFKSEAEAEKEIKRVLKGDNK